MTKRIAVLTSGGDAPGMNACIRALVIEAERKGYTILGFEHGYQGLLNNDSKPLNTRLVHNHIQRGGTLLRSARCKQFETDDGASLAAANLESHNIDALVIIGGDGSFRGGVHLSQFWNGQIIGLPGTIDNDIYGTDATIGYYTAIETAVTSIDKIRDTAEAFERVFVVEVMGRHAGFLGLNAAIASASNFAILPELFHDTEQTLTQCIEQINVHQQRYGHESFIIVLAEKLWPGGINALCEQLSQLTTSEIRPVILGHVQRGGSPVSQDRLLATKLAIRAIEAISQGESGVMVGEKDHQGVTVALADTWHNKKCMDTLTMQTLNALLNTRHHIDV